MDILNITHGNQLNFCNNGFLEPILFDHEGKVTFSSPYNVTLTDLTDLFSFNKHRETLMENLVRLLEALEKDGITVIQIFVGGSYVSKNEKPHDLDVLICWTPGYRIKNTKALEEFIFQKRHAFNKSRIEQELNIQVHFQGMLGSISNSLLTISKWVKLNSYSRELKKHRGIVTTIFSN